MITLLIYMFSLMIVALLIGFAFGWIIRRKATRVGYEENIDELNIRDQDSITNININAMELEDSNIRLLNTEDKLTTQKNLILSLSKKNEEIKNDIENLKISQTRFLNDIQDVDKKINSSSKDLGILTSQKDEILKYREHITENEDKIDQKTKATQALSESITAHISNRESLNTKITNESNKIVDIDAEIALENEKSATIIDEFNTKKSEIVDEVEESKLKALNYKYAFEYTKEKLDSNEKIEFDVIDKIINKNEEKGFFSNLKEKLFSKSAIYIKGGK